jgi:uncharacterized protein (TIGR02246 family)
MNTRILCIVATVLVAASCTSKAPQPDKRSLEQTAIREVRALTALRAAALEQGDIEGTLAAYTEDAVWLPAHSEEFVGKDLARAKLKRILETVSIREEQQEDEHALLAPDVLLDRGNYAVEMAPRKGGSAMLDGGTYLTIWRKSTDGKWRIAYQMWTSHRSLDENSFSGAK